MQAAAIPADATTNIVLMTPGYDFGFVQYFPAIKPTTTPVPMKARLVHAESFSDRPIA